MPESDPITRVLDEVRAAFIEDRRGDVATYIPQLSATPPDLFGISLASLEGRVYSAGDSAYYQAEIPHSTSNEGKAPARAFVMVTPAML